MSKFRPRKGRVSEKAADAFESKYGDNGSNDSIEPNTVSRAGSGGATVVKRPKGKARATYYLPVDVIEALKDAVVSLRTAPRRFTMAGVVGDAIRAEVERLAGEYNDGKPFPARETDPYVGRPPK